MKRKNHLLSQFLLIAIIFLCPKSYAQLERTQLFIVEGVADKELKLKMETNASTVLTAMNASIISGKKTDIPSSAITDDGKKSLKAQWATSPMSCPKSVIQEKGLKRSTGTYQVINIPVLLHRYEGDTASQFLIFNFTKEGKVDEILVSFETNNMTVFWEGYTVEDIIRKEKIKDLLERFKTAYNEKNIPYLNKIFSEKALIITGKEIKVKKMSDQSDVLVETKSVEYKVQTKQEYLKRLESVFKNNRVIDVTFEVLDIHIHPKYPEIYGVIVKQGWTSSNYSDIGYLFLMIDFKDEAFPLIHVRAWQPEKYSDGQLFPQEEIFKVTDFNIKSAY